MECTRVFFFMELRERQTEFRYSINFENHLIDIVKREFIPYKTYNSKGDTKGESMILFIATIRHPENSFYEVRNGKDGLRPYLIQIKWGDHDDQQAEGELTFEGYKTDGRVFCPYIGVFNSTEFSQLTSELSRARNSEDIPQAQSLSYLFCWTLYENKNWPALKAYLAFIECFPEEAKFEISDLDLMIDSILDSISKASDPEKIQEIFFGYIMIGMACANDLTTFSLTETMKSPYVKTLENMYSYFNTLITFNPSDELFLSFLKGFSIVMALNSISKQEVISFESICKNKDHFCLYTLIYGFYLSYFNCDVLIKCKNILNKQFELIWKKINNSQEFSTKSCIEILNKVIEEKFQEGSHDIDPLFMGYIMVIMYFLLAERKEAEEVMEFKNSLRNIPNPIVKEFIATFIKAFETPIYVRNSEKVDRFLPLNKPFRYNAEVPPSKRYFIFEDDINKYFVIHRNTSKQFPSLLDAIKQEGLTDNELKKIVISKLLKSKVRKGISIILFYILINCLKKGTLDSENKEKDKNQYQNIIIMILERNEVLKDLLNNLSQLDKKLNVANYNYFEFFLDNSPYPWNDDSSKIKSLNLTTSNNEVGTLNARRNFLTSNILEECQRHDICRMFAAEVVSLKTYFSSEFINEILQSEVIPKSILKEFNPIDCINELFNVNIHLFYFPRNDILKLTKCPVKSSLSTGNKATFLYIDAEKMSEVDLECYSLLEIPMTEEAIYLQRIKRNIEGLELSKFLERMHLFPVKFPVTFIIETKLLHMIGGVFLDILYKEKEQINSSEHILKINENVLSIQNIRLRVYLANAFNNYCNDLFIASYFKTVNKSGQHKLIEALKMKRASPSYFDLIEAISSTEQMQYLKILKLDEENSTKHYIHQLNSSKHKSFLEYIGFPFSFADLAKLLNSDSGEKLEITSKVQTLLKGLLIETIIADFQSSAEFSEYNEIFPGEENYGIRKLISELRESKNKYDNDLNKNKNMEDIINDEPPQFEIGKENDEDPIKKCKEKEKRLQKILVQLKNLLLKISSSCSNLPLKKFFELYSKKFPENKLSKEEDQKLSPQQLRDIDYTISKISNLNMTIYLTLTTSHSRIEKLITLGNEEEQNHISIILNIKAQDYEQIQEVNIKEELEKISLKVISDFSVFIDNEKKHIYNYFEKYEFVSNLKDQLMRATELEEVFFYITNKKYNNDYKYTFLSQVFFEAFTLQSKDANLAINKYKSHLLNILKKKMLDFQIEIKADLEIKEISIKKELEELKNSIDILLSETYCTCIFTENVNTINPDNDFVMRWNEFVYFHLPIYLSSYQLLKKFCEDAKKETLDANLYQELQQLMDLNNLPELVAKLKGILINHCELIDKLVLDGASSFIKVTSNQMPDYSYDKELEQIKNVVKTFLKIPEHKKENKRIICYGINIMASQLKETTEYDLEIRATNMLYMDRTICLPGRNIFIIANTIEVINEQTIDVSGESDFILMNEQENEFSGRRQKESSKYSQKGGKLASQEEFSKLQKVDAGSIYMYANKYINYEHLNIKANKGKIIYEKETLKNIYISQNLNANGKNTKDGNLLTEFPSNKELDRKEVKDKQVKEGDGGNILIVQFDPPRLFHSEESETEKEPVLIFSKEVKFSKIQVEKYPNDIEISFNLSESPESKSTSEQEEIETPTEETNLTNPNLENAKRSINKILFNGFTFEYNFLQIRDVLDLNKNPYIFGQSNSHVIESLIGKIKKYNLNIDELIACNIRLNELEQTLYFKHLMDKAFAQLFSDLQLKSDFNFSKKSLFIEDKNLNIGQNVHISIDIDHNLEKEDFPPSKIECYYEFANVSLNYFSVNPNNKYISTEIYKRFSTIYHSYKDYSFMNELELLLELIKVNFLSGELLEKDALQIINSLDFFLCKIGTMNKHRTNYTYNQGDDFEIKFKLVLHSLMEFEDIRTCITIHNKENQRTLSNFEKDLLIKCKEAFPKNYCYIILKEGSIEERMKEFGKPISICLAILCCVYIDVDFKAYEKIYSKFSEIRFDININPGIKKFDKRILEITKYYQYQVDIPQDITINPTLLFHLIKRKKGNQIDFSEIYKLKEEEYKNHKDDIYNYLKLKFYSDLDEKYFSDSSILAFPTIMKIDSINRKPLLLEELGNSLSNFIKEQLNHLSDIKQDLISKFESFPFEFCELFKSFIKNDMDLSLFNLLIEKLNNVEKENTFDLVDLLRILVILKDDDNKLLKLKLMLNVAPYRWLNMILILKINDLTKKAYTRKLQMAPREQTILQKLLEIGPKENIFLQLLVGKLIEEFRGNKVIPISLGSIFEILGSILKMHSEHEIHNADLNTNRLIDELIAYPISHFNQRISYFLVGILYPQKMEVSNLQIEKAIINYGFYDIKRLGNKLSMIYKKNPHLDINIMKKIFRKIIKVKYFIPTLLSNLDKIIDKNQEEIENELNKDKVKIMNEPLDFDEIISQMREKGSNEYSLYQMDIPNETELDKSVRNINSQVDLFNRENTNNENQPSDKIKMEINKFVEDYEKKTKESRLDQSDLHKFIAYICYSVNKIYGYKLYQTQLISLLLLTKRSQAEMNNKLAEIRTGEGKSLLIVMLAIIKAVEGNYVDIITSSPILAIRDSENIHHKNLLKLFGLSARNISDEQCEKDPVKRKKRYESKIVYGTIRNLQKDYLYDKFYRRQDPIRGQRQYNILILDEVDSIMLDKSHYVCYITSNDPSLFHLNELLSHIWKIVNENKDIDNDKIKLYFQFLVKTKKIIIPTWLDEFINKCLDKWIGSGRIAQVTEEDNEYIQLADQDDLIKIIDKDTGSYESFCTWANGLHQFINFKHSGNLVPLKLKEFFISNFHYVKLYGQIIGLSGTLGSQSSLDLFINSYDFRKENIYLIPRSFNRVFIENKERICGNEDEWIDAILGDIKDKINSRPILVLSENIKTGRFLYGKIASKRSEINSNLKIYKYLIQSKKPEILYQMEKGIPTIENLNLLISTNLCGRGVDILLNDNAVRNGGLHVILTFIPKNSRIKDQAFGRSARNGQPGSGRMIILPKEGNVNINNLNLQTELFEINKIENIRNKVFPKIEIEHNLLEQFHGFTIEIFKLIDNAIIQEEVKEFHKEILRNRWTFFLESIDLEANSEEKIKNKFKAFLDEIRKDIRESQKNSFVVGNTPINCAKLAAVWRKEYEKTSNPKFTEYELKCYRKSIEIDSNFSEVSFYNKAVRYLEYYVLNHNNYLIDNLIYKKKEVREFLKNSKKCLRQRIDSLMCSIGSIQSVNSIILNRQQFQTNYYEDQISIKISAYERVINNIEAIYNNDYDEFHTILSSYGQEIEKEFPGFFNQLFIYFLNQNEYNKYRLQDGITMPCNHQTKLKESKKLSNYFPNYSKVYPSILSSLITVNPFYITQNDFGAIINSYYSPDTTLPDLLFNCMVKKLIKPYNKYKLLFPFYENEDLISQRADQMIESFFDILLRKYKKIDQIPEETKKKIIHYIFSIISRLKLIPFKNMEIHFNSKIQESNYKIGNDDSDILVGLDTIRITLKPTSKNHSTNRLEISQSPNFNDKLTYKLNQNQNYLTPLNGSFGISDVPNFMPGQEEINAHNRVTWKDWILHSFNKIIDIGKPIAKIIMDTVLFIKAFLPEYSPNLGNNMIELVQKKQIFSTGFNNFDAASYLSNQFFSMVSNNYHIWIEMQINYIVEKLYIDFEKIVKKIIEVTHLSLKKNNLWKIKNWILLYLENYGIFSNYPNFPLYSYGNVYALIQTMEKINPEICKTYNTISKWINNFFDQISIGNSKEYLRKTLIRSLKFAEYIYNLYSDGKGENLKAKNYLNSALETHQSIIHQIKLSNDLFCKVQNNPFNFQKAEIEKETKPLKAKVKKFQEIIKLAISECLDAISRQILKVSGKDHFAEDIKTILIKLRDQFVNSQKNIFEISNELINFLISLPTFQTLYGKNPKQSYFDKINNHQSKLYTALKEIREEIEEYSNFQKDPVRSIFIVINKITQETYQNNLIKKVKTSFEKLPKDENSLNNYILKMSSSQINIQDNELNNISLIVKEISKNIEERIRFNYRNFCIFENWLFYVNNPISEYSKAIPGVLIEYSNGNQNSPKGNSINYFISNLAQFNNDFLSNHAILDNSILNRQVKNLYPIKKFLEETKATTEMNYHGYNGRQIRNRRSNSCSKEIEAHSKVMKQTLYCLRFSPYASSIKGSI